jgi:hypothetical protein
MVKKSFLKGFSAKNAVRNDFRTAKPLFRICSVLSYDMLGLINYRRGKTDDHTDGHNASHHVLYQVL